MTFDDSALEAIAACVRKVTVPDPVATPVYDMMSDGLLWSDERQTLFFFFFEYIGIARCLLCYRTSLILRKPRHEFAGVWERALELFPYWIGFLPERCGLNAGLTDFIARSRNRSGQDIDRMMQVSDRLERMQKRNKQAE